MKHISVGFINNKYYRWYLAICAISDESDYTERHHRIPRSMGGGEGDNLVTLSFRKHFLAHWLLIKCTEGEDKRKMLWAFTCLRRSNGNHRRILAAWQYEAICRAFVDGRLYHENGRRTVELGLGFHSMTLDQKAEAGRKGGKKTVDLGVGIHSLTLEQRIENGRKGGLLVTFEQHVKGGRRLAELGLSPFQQMTSEQRIENSRKAGLIGGQRTYELRRGIHSLTPEERFKRSQKVGSQNVVLQRGFFSRSPTKRIEDSRKGGLKAVELGTTPAQRRTTCPHCGLESNLMILRRWHFDKCPKRMV